MTEPAFENRVAEHIHLILRDFLKVIKVISMYPPDNPMPQSMQQSFAERLVDLVDEHQGLKFQIEKGKIFWNGEEVYEDKSREEALAAIFFDAGITVFQLSPGLNWDDVKALLKVIRRHQNKEETARDLASALWEANLDGFTFRTIEDIALAEYDGSFRVQEFTDLSSTDRNLKADPEAAAMYESLFVGVEYEGDGDPQDYDADTFTGRRVESGDLANDSTGIRRVPVSGRQVPRSSGSAPDPGPAETDSHVGDQAGWSDGVDASLFFDLGDTVEGVKPATSAMGLDDVRPSALDNINTSRMVDSELQPSPEERAALDNMLYRDAAFDMVESTVELLKEMLHQEETVAAFAETVTICDRMMATFLKNGLISATTDLVGYLRIHQDTLRREKPQWAARIDETMTMLGSRERLSGLVQGLNAYGQIESDQVAAFLRCFDWQAISTVSELLPSLQHAHHRQAITDFLASHGSNHIGIVARNLQSKDLEVVGNAVSVLGGVGTDEAIEHLARALSHREPDIRLAVVEALEQCESEVVIELFARAAQDPESDVRATAVAALVKRRGSRAFEAIAGLLESEMFGSLEPSEQKSLFVAYSVLGGDHAVDHLVELAAKANPLGDTRLKSLRESAFEALAHNHSDKCEKFLLRMTSSWRPDIKQRAIVALKARRDRLYGDH